MSKWKSLIFLSYLFNIMERTYKAKRHIISRSKALNIADKKVEKTEIEDVKTEVKDSDEPNVMKIEHNSDITKQELNKLLSEIGRCLTDFRKPKYKKKYNYKKKNLHGGSIQEF